MRLLAHGSMRQEHPELHDWVAKYRASHTDERAESFAAVGPGVRLSEYVAHEPAKIAVFLALCRRIVGPRSRACEFLYVIRST